MGGEVVVKRRRAGERRGGRRADFPPLVLPRYGKSPPSGLALVSPTPKYGGLLLGQPHIKTSKHLHRGPFKSALTAFTGFSLARCSCTSAIEG